MRRPLNRLPATQLARMIAAHDVTCEAVTHSFIDAIHDGEREVRAFAWFDADRAIATAREFDRLEWRGTLHGLPAAIKDNIDTADIPSHYGSTIFLGHVPQADAASVAALRAAGAFVLGQDGDRRARQLHSGPDAQSGGTEAHAGRLVERFGGRGGGSHGALCDRHPDRGFGDPSGRILRRRWFRSDARLRAPRRRQGRVRHARCRRRICAQCRGRRTGRRRARVAASMAACAGPGPRAVRRVDGNAMVLPAGTLDAGGARKGGPPAGGARRPRARAGVAVRREGRPAGLQPPRRRPAHRSVVRDGARAGTRVAVSA